MQQRRVNAQLDSYPAVLTTQQVCEILQVSRETVYKLVHSGTLVPIRLRGLRSRRFALGAIQKLIGA